MSIKIPDFVREIYSMNKKYTPKQILDYIQETKEEPLGFPSKPEKLISCFSGSRPSEIQFLCINSYSKAKSIIEKYKLEESQELQRDSSSAGKELSDLIMTHSGAVIRLILREASRRGIFV